MILHSSGATIAGGPWTRYSISACPKAYYRFDGKSSLQGTLPNGMSAPTWTHDPLQDLDLLLEMTRRANPRLNDQAVADLLPFAGGWIGYFSYDLGRVIEPAATCGQVPARDRDWPLIELAYCPDALIFDNHTGQMFTIGQPDFAPPHHTHYLPTRNAQLESQSFSVGSLTPRQSPERYQAAVQQTLDHIAAGDIYQANIAQRFTAPFTGSTRHFAQHALDASEAWYGSYLEMPGGRRLISLSPELFLQFDATGNRLVTRPIKGTSPSSSTPDQLADSTKDAAELHMIVDLMRNDLGRICKFGSVRVEHDRTIETHGTVHHGVGQVTGTMRDDVTIGQMLAATFPGGSVTGAPKIRAMQIIEELEPVQRGPYCGAIGYISDCGNLCLSIAIRTILLSGQAAEGRWDQLDGQLDYSAGCGIVADSTPDREYTESLDKTAVLRNILSAESSDMNVTQLHGRSIPVPV